MIDADAAAIFELSGLKRKRADVFESQPQESQESQDSQESQGHMPVPTLAENANCDQNDLEDQVVDLLDDGSVDLLEEHEVKPRDAKRIRLAESDSDSDEESERSEDSEDSESEDDDDEDETQCDDDQPEVQPEVQSQPQPEVQSLPQADQGREAHSFPSRWFLQVQETSRRFLQVQETSRSTAERSSILEVSRSPKINLVNSSYGLESIFLEMTAYIGEGPAPFLYSVKPDDLNDVLNAVNPRVGTDQKRVAEALGDFVRELFRGLVEVKVIDLTKFD